MPKGPRGDVNENATRVVMAATGGRGSGGSDRYQKEATAGGNYSGNYGAGGSAADPAYEGLTRQIMRDMGGEQPNEGDWCFMFPKASSGGTTSSSMANKMQFAYNLARAGYTRAHPPRLQIPLR